MTVCIIYIAHFFYKNKNDLFKVFSLDIETIIYILLLQLIYYLLQGYRFKLVLEKCSNLKIPFFPWLRMFILGRFLNMVFAQMGNIYRSVRLKQEYKVPYTRYISGLTSIAWMDTCLNLFIAIVIILVVNPHFSVGNLSAWKVLIVLAFSFSAAPIIAEIIFRKINLKNKHLQWIHSKLSEVLTVSVTNLKDIKYMSKITALGIAVFIRTCIMFYIYFTVLKIYINLPAIVIFYALFKISAFIMITPGNLGVQEIAYGFLSEYVGIGEMEGLIVATLIRVVAIFTTSILGLTLGGFDLIRHRKKYTELEE